MNENIINIETNDNRHVLRQNANQHRVLFPNSFICKEHGENLGWIVLENKTIPQEEVRNDAAAIHFIQTYNRYRDELPSYQIISMFQRNDDKIIYDIFDRTCDTLPFGSFCGE